MENPKVTELIAANTELEKRLHALIESFERETGVEVRSVEIERLDQIGPKSFFARVLPTIAQRSDDVQFVISASSTYQTVTVCESD